MILLKVCSAASLLGEGFMNQVTSTNKASLSLLSLTMKVACLLTWFAPEDPHVVSVLSSSQEGLPLSLLVAQVC